MKYVRLLFPLSLAVWLFGCTTMSESVRSKLANGYYETKNPQRKPEKRYVYYKNDTIRIYPVNSSDHKTIDTTRASAIVCPPETKNAPDGKFTFSKKMWSFNFQTILFKFRPSTANLPTQLNTDFNFNLYLGRRTDIYHVSYQANPLAFKKRKFDHFAYSFGFFTGFGKTPMSGSVTQNQITYAYDGLIWLNGVGAILGTKSFTFGVGVGMDQLLDHNRDLWIYQHKPWAGLLLGLQLR